MTTTAPKPPPGLGTSGRRLWRSVVDSYTMAEHELTLLREACRTADAVDLLQAQLDRDGVMSESSQGVRVHPALAELRQQRITLARLLAALQVPAEQGDQSRPVRAPRGVYGLRSAQ